MENASKALIMAAAVLLGIMLLSIGVYLFSIFGDFSSQISNTLSEKEINEFNAQFYKYEGKTDCRIHDIVSIANLAKENNNKYGYTDSDKSYIKVNVNGIPKFEHGAPILENISREYKNFEQLNDYSSFLSKYSVSSSGENIYFECTKVIINADTKLVNSITFKKMVFDDDDVVIPISPVDKIDIH